MSVVHSTLDLAGRATEWANPILVKETRQALKSKQFIATFLLVLVAAWLISAFGMLLAGDQMRYGTAGREFFFFYMCVLATAVVVIVPFGAFRGLLSERDMNTYELLSITTLSPRQIVWGKLWSAVVQVLIYYSAIAPFIAFTSLLEGFDLAQVAFVLAALFLVSLAASMISLMFSTLARHRAWQAVVSVLLLGGLVGLLGFTIGMGGGAMSGQLVAFDDPDFWWAIGMYLVAAAAYFVLCQQITTTQLTFESDNRSSGIRLTCAAHFWLWIGAWVAYAMFGPSGTALDRDALAVIVTCAGIHWFIAGLVIGTEDEYLSRRIRRNLWRHRALRLVAAPFLPGGARGLAYLLLHLALLWLVVVWLALVYVSSDLAPIMRLVTGMCCYVWIYIGLGAAVARLARRVSHDIRPAHARVLVLGLLAAGLIGPYIPLIADLFENSSQYSFFFVSNPMATLPALAEPTLRTQDAMIAFVLLLLMAVLVLLMNVVPMWRGVAEIVAAPVRPRRARQPQVAGHAPAM